MVYLFGRPSQDHVVLLFVRSIFNRFIELVISTRHDRSQSSIDEGVFLDNARLQYMYDACGDREEADSVNNIRISIIN